VYLCGDENAGRSENIRQIIPFERVEHLKYLGRTVKEWNILGCKKFLQFTAKKPLKLATRLLKHV
jgi:hypothetical protein